jgi:hypothetical protein
MPSSFLYDRRDSCPAHSDSRSQISDKISAGSDIFDRDPDTRNAVLGRAGMCDFGPASIIDALDTANSIVARPPDGEPLRRETESRRLPG